MSIALYLLSAFALACGTVLLNEIYDEVIK
jgi:hypothetical protein